MALLRKYVPNFDGLTDDELKNRLHCWEHCALVTFRTQRQMARMHVRMLRDELERRERAQVMGNVVPFPQDTPRNSLPTA
jgi:hypothetical protein